MGMTFSKTHILFLFLMSFIIKGSIHAQTENVRERVFIDVNSNDLLVGETLQYAAFNLSHSTSKISQLSKFLYVELIGEDGVVFQRKHELINGKAHGDFFVPSDITTGQYYLVAYTRWMRNFNDVSKVPLVFINPYKGHKNADSVAVATNVLFNTLSGEIVANEANQVVFKVTQGQKTIASKGRIIGNEQRIADVSSNAAGLGYFEFTPKADVNYQLLLQQPNGGFEFFDLPKVKTDGIGLNISHSSELIEALPIGNVMGGNVTIKHQGETVFERTVQSSFPMRIEREDLPKGILTIAFSDSQGNEQFSAPLFNTAIQQTEGAISATTRTTVNVAEELPKGSYSISVRKQFNKHLPEQHATFAKHSLTFPKGLNLNEQQQAAIFQSFQSKPIPETVDYLPEYRYQLLEGQLVTDGGNAPISGQNVILSLTGESTINMSVGKTDKNGKFLVEYTTVNRGIPTSAHLSINDFEHEYAFQVQNSFVDHSFSFSPVIIDTTQLESIRQRSIISQIDNAYFTPTLDSTGIKNSVLPTIAAFNASYEFDDYVRFRSLKQHFVEYIPFAGVRERKDGKRFVVYSVDEGVKFETSPLILLDGVPVNGADLLEFSPYRIKSVDILNKRLFFGSLIRDGVLSFQTIEGNLGGFNINSNHLGFELLTPEPNSTPKNFEPSNNPRIPDTRIQLLWQPDFVVNEASIQQINFITSDVEGNFELVIEGFAENGTPITIVKNIEVKALSNE